jgi:hypothetical protein
VTADLPFDHYLQLMRKLARKFGQLYALSLGEPKAEMMQEA